MIEQESYFNKNKFYQISINIGFFLVFGLILVKLFGNDISMTIRIFYSSLAFVIFFNRPIFLFGVFYTVTLTSQLFDGNIFFIYFERGISDDGLTVLSNYVGYFLIIHILIKRNFLDFKFHKIDLYLIIFLIIMFISGIFSETPENMLSFMKRMIQYVIVFVIIRIFIKNKKNIESFFYINLFLATIVLAVLTWQYFTGYLGRPHLAYSALPFFIAYMMIIDFKHYKWIFICFATTFIAFLAESRRIFMGTSVIWILFLNDYFVNVNKYKKVLAISLLPMILFLIAPASLSVRISQGFEGIIGLSEGLEFSELSSDAFTKRDQLWAIGFAMWIDNMVFGVGTMNAQGLMNSYGDFDEDFSLYRMHNAYLRILVEQGIIGLVIFFMVMFTTISYSFEANNILKLNQNKLIYWFNKIVLYKIVSLFILYIFGGWAIYDKLFWMDIASVIIIYDYSKNPDETFSKIV